MQSDKYIREKRGCRCDMRLVYYGCLFVARRTQLAVRFAIAAPDGTLLFAALLVLPLVVCCSSSMQPYGAIAAAGRTLLVVFAVCPLRMPTSCILLCFLPWVSCASRHHDEGGRATAGAPGCTVAEYSHNAYSRIKMPHVNPWGSGLKEE